MTQEGRSGDGALGNCCPTFSVKFSFSELGIAFKAGTFVMGMLFNPFNSPPSSLRKAPLGDEGMESQTLMGRG